MFKKDTFRLIKKTFNRFFSLLMIVLIGTAFMMGLMSNPTIMRGSVDKYDDDNNLQDIQLYSSYGFCDEDVKAIKAYEGIENVQASKQVDVYCRRKDGSIVVARVLESDPKVNGYDLTSGREPRASRECLVLANMNSESAYQIGDALTFFFEDEDKEISDYLKFDEYEIVGGCKTPAYMSKVLGTSNLKNQDLDLIVYVPKDNFVFEYYTTVFLTLEGARDKQSYTSDYDDYIESKLDLVEDMAASQQDYLKTKIYDEYKEELDDAIKEFEEEKLKGQTELDDAKKKLDEANVQIIASQMDVDTYTSIIAATEQQIGGSKATLDERKASNDAAKRNIESKYGVSFDNAVNSVTSDYTTYTTNKATITAQENSIIALQEQNDRLTAQKAGLDPVDDASQIASIDAMIAYNESQIANLNSTAMVEYRQSLQNSCDAIDNAYIAKGYSGVDDAYRDISTISSESVSIQASYTGIDEGYDLINEMKAKIADMQKQINDGKREYEKGLREYSDGVKEFNEKIEEAQADINKAKQDLEDLPTAKWMILTRDSHYSSYMYKGSCDQMAAIGYTLPILFYLVAALVCMTTMTRLVDEQRSQIGIYRALGYSKIQVIGKYVSYAILASLIGSIIGIIVGQFIFPTVIYNTWRLMYDFPDMIMMFPIKYVIICTLAFTVLMTIVTANVVNITLKECSASLMRPKAPKSAKAILLEKINFIWRRLSFTSKITARNLIRYKTRFFMTVIGVAGCTGLLVVGYGIKDSIADVIDIQFGRIFGYDYQIYLENDYHIDENVEILLENESNDVVVPFMAYTSKVYLSDDDATITVEIMNARKFNEVMGIKMIDRKTDLKLNSDGVIISQKFAINNDVSKGDYITIESKNGVKKQVKVVEICEMYFQHYLFMSDAYYEEIFDEPVHNTNIAIKTDDLDSLKQDIKKLEDYSSMVDFSSMIEQFQIMIEALDLIILVIILTAGSLAFVVLINLTQVNISERIREIATLKVLGFRDIEVNSYIFKEILLLSFIGALVGLPLGVLEHHFIMNVINMEMVMFGMNISILSFTYSFLITIVFTIIVLYFTRKPLRQVNMIESLKSVE